MITPQGTLLVYDNGNFRASPFDPPILDQSNYSRGVEFSINETNMEVSQVWDSTAAGGDRLYTPIFGKTQWLPQTHDLLVTYGFVSYINGAYPSPYAPGAAMSRIIEYTHDPVPQVVFDLSFFDYNNTSPRYGGYEVYRALRIPTLLPPRQSCRRPLRERDEWFCEPGILRRPGAYLQGPSFHQFDGLDNDSNGGAGGQRRRLRISRFERQPVLNALLPRGHAVASVQQTGRTRYGSKWPDPSGGRLSELRFTAPISPPCFSRGEPRTGRACAKRRACWSSLTTSFSSARASSGWFLATYNSAS